MILHNQFSNFRCNKNFKIQYLLPYVRNLKGKIKVLANNFFQSEHKVMVELEFQDTFFKELKKN